MSSAILIRCHACKARIKAPRKIIGQVRACPRCKQAVRIRIQAPEDAGPALISERTAEETGVAPARTARQLEPGARKQSDTKVILTPA